MHIHYFQRYHSKENVVTANTMLMLSRLYKHSADKFFAMLSSLILETQETPEITFNLQAAGKRSVPDAIISQKSFKVVVETKLYNQFEKTQLKNHLEQFGAEDIKVLLTLDPEPMKDDVKKEVEKSIEAYWKENNGNYTTPVRHVNLTFERLVNAMEDIIDERDMDLINVLEDFKEYCIEEKLIGSSQKWMRAVAAGTTFDDNINYRLFYDVADKKYSYHGYIGLYKKKSIRAVGKLEKTVCAYKEDGEIKFEPENISEDYKNRIRNAISSAEKFGYDLLREKHWYYMVDEFYKINFIKTSKYGLMKSKFFNLANMFGYITMPDTAEIAKHLDGRIWEEF